MAATPLQVVILAAGKGKRMRSDLPKVLHALAGRPLLAHVLAAARALSPRRLCVVVGHGGSVVRERLAKEAIANRAGTEEYAKALSELAQAAAQLQAIRKLRQKR